MPLPIVMMPIVMIIARRCYKKLAGASRRHVVCWLSEIVVVMLTAGAVMGAAFALTVKVSAKKTTVVMAMAR